MKRLRVGVVGVGFWGKNHARIYHETPFTELKAVCDKDKAKALETAKKYSIDGYTDSSCILKREDIDAVSICTWSTELAKETIKALRAGKHVLVEKPMAITTIEAERAIKLSEEMDLCLMVGFIERFNPGVQIVKKSLERGETGKIVSAFSRRVSRWPERIGDIGIVKDTAIHDLDLFTYLFDEDPTAVYARTGNFRHARFEDYAQIMLRFESEVTAVIETNWLTPYKIRRLVITGSEAMLSLDYLSQRLKIEKFGGRIVLPHRWREPLLRELKHFASCILKGGEPLTTGHDGLKALKIADAVLKSSRRNEVIKIKDL